MEESTWDGIGKFCWKYRGFLILSFEVEKYVLLFQGFCTGIGLVRNIWPVDTNQNSGFVDHLLWKNHLGARITRLSWLSNSNEPVSCVIWKHETVFPMTCAGKHRSWPGLPSGGVLRLRMEQWEDFFQLHAELGGAGVWKRRLVGWLSDFESFGYVFKQSIQLRFGGTTCLKKLPCLPPGDLKHCSWVLWSWTTGHWSWWSSPGPWCCSSFGYTVVRISSVAWRELFRVSGNQQ